MPTITRTFSVQPAPATVVDYLKDFGHAEQWDPGTESCEPLESGPVHVGSRWHNVSKIAGVTTELDYELTELSEDRIVLRGENDSATSTDTILVRPHGRGSEITYTAVIEAKGIGKVAEPLLKLLFERLGSKTEEQMTDVLNALGA